MSGVRAPQHRPHARRELPRRERLRHVVVRAELEADDPVGLLAPCGQQDDRQVGARPDPAAELEPVDPRQHDVEDHEPRALGLEQLPGGGAVAGLERAEAVALEVAQDDLADDRLVVNDEHGGAHRDIVRHIPYRGMNCRRRYTVSRTGL